ncbi:MAG: preprotein translocase subunit SecG [Lachnospiraceae bacterium]|nr:preprotein translocase subunit SecG [Lachnospiraceae bacterium]
MEALRMVVAIVFIIVCIVLTVLVLMQEGKSAGLGSISGAAESYWGKNKGRSMEGLLVKLTKVAAVLFMVLAIVLNLNVF